MRRFFPIFILIIVTFGLTVGGASGGQHGGDASKWSQGDLQIEASKAGTAPCVLVRPALPLHVAEDPRAVAAVVLSVAPGFRSAIYTSLSPVRAEVPNPPSLTGRVVIRV